MKRLFQWRIIRWIALGIAAILMVIQFVPVDRSNAAVTTEVPAPPHVRAVLRRACYDCHSNETVWPWYSRVAPVSWLVARDVREGRRELNLSMWDQYGDEKRAKKLKEVREEVEEGKMPFWLYLPLHPEAALSDQDKAVLRQWTLDMR